ncbi:MAG: hypothetical protein QXM29_03020 [Nitrososphaerales archaeon]
MPKEEFEERVLLIDPTDEKYMVAFNPLERLEGVSPNSITELAEEFQVSENFMRKRLKFREPFS